MAASRSYEAQLLEAPARIIAGALRSLKVPDVDEARYQFLEAAASTLSGIALEEIHVFHGDSRLLDRGLLESVAAQLLHEVQKTPVPPQLAIASLARPEFEFLVKRRAGAYYTDFRLATHLANQIKVVSGARAVDPACGSGALLVALTLRSGEQGSVQRDDFIANGVHGADKDSRALRGAFIALASAASTAAAISQLAHHLRHTDSLVAGEKAWLDVAPSGFDVVITNPPWEKLKLTRHEYLAAAGVARHYGAEYAQADLDGSSIDEQKYALGKYKEALAREFELSGSGEIDLYKLFAELSVRLAAPESQVALILPGGLIRSQGTSDLRKYLLDKPAGVQVDVIENRARFFEIDSRFKFLAVHMEKGRRSRFVRLRHGFGDDAAIRLTGAVRIPGPQLARIRPDLTVPEVKSQADWERFLRMALGAPALGSPDSRWPVRFSRELDMTSDRELFDRSRSRPSGQHLPVVEGRMVHQYRFGAKKYEEGTGRRARWAPVPLGGGVVGPQYWIAAGSLPARVVGRVTRPRVGFCDVTGQTNERSMLAGLIPQNTVCGNKVPTITFEGDDSESLSYLWLAVANSFAFDWYLRRVVTTSLNYFLLRSCPFPDPYDGFRSRSELVGLVSELVRADQAGSRPADLWNVAEARARIDVLVLQDYSLGQEDLRALLDDFPLLDRGQPAIRREPRSTITRDFLMLKAAKHFGADASTYAARVQEARDAGAIPYVPSEFVGVYRSWSKR